MRLQQFWKNIISNNPQEEVTENKVLQLEEEKREILQKITIYNEEIQRLQVLVDEEKNKSKQSDTQLQSAARVIQGLKNEIEKYVNQAKDSDSKLKQIEILKQSNIKLEHEKKDIEHLYKLEQKLTTQKNSEVQQLAKELASARGMYASQIDVETQLKAKHKEEVAVFKMQIDGLVSNQKEHDLQLKEQIFLYKQQIDELNHKLKEQTVISTSVKELEHILLKDIEKEQQKYNSLNRQYNEVVEKNKQLTTRIFAKEKEIEISQKKQQSLDAIIEEYELKLLELRKEVNIEKGNIAHEKMMLRKTMQTNKNRIEELELIVKKYESMKWGTEDKKIDVIIPDTNEIAILKEDSASSQPITNEIHIDEIKEQAITIENNKLEAQDDNIHQLLQVEAELVKTPVKIEIPAKKEYVPSKENHVKTEKNYDKEHVETLMKSVIDDAFDNTTKKKKQKRPDFLKRDDKNFENEQMTKAVYVAREEYEMITPYTGDKYAIRDFSEMETDYASAFARASLNKHYAIRRENLLDFMNKPYFARFDVITERNSATTYYISDASIAVGYNVISWKSPVASLYYLKTVGVPINHKTLGEIEVDYIQDFGVSRGEIINLYTPLVSNSNQHEQEHLIEMLNKNKGESMESIVSTIQKEQYQMISLPIDKSIIIQGSAGSGKSAIALHRLSYLIYQYKTLTSDKVVIIGPNETFLQYIKLVLPALGDYDVHQLTLVSLAQHFIGELPSISNETNKHNITIKGLLSFGERVERAVLHEINSLSNWVVPLEVDGEYVLSLPVLKQMDNYKHISNKERINLYYNFYLKQYSAQMQHNKELTEKLQKQLDQLAQKYSNDQITQYLMELQHHFNINKDAINLHKMIEHEISSYVQTSIADMQPLQSNLLDDIIQQKWNAYKQNYMLKEQDIYYSKRLADGDHYTNYSQLQQSIIEKDWNEFKLTIEDQLSLEKEAFYSEEVNQLTALVMNNVKYYSIQALQKSINDKFRSLMPQYTINLSKKFKYLALQKIEKSDTANKLIKQYVEKRIELNPVAIYDKILTQNKQFNDIQHISGKITKHDIAPLLHVNRLVNGINETKRFSYMIIDEAQDYMPYEIQEMRKLTSINGIMLIGDLGQNINELNPLQNWNDYDKLLNEPHHFELSATYRSTKPIVEFNNAIIAPFAEGRYNLSKVAYRDGEAVDIVTFNNAVEEEGLLVKTIEKHLASVNCKQVTIIVKNDLEIDKYLDIIDPYFINKVQTDVEKADDCKVVLTTVEYAKGLEFETVILVNFNSYSASDLDRKLAYVAASRALHKLIVFKDNSKSCPLFKYIE